jgi:UPF0042 nucleotide-binding protein
MINPPRLSVVLVTGLSGGGKASILRALEDVGYEAVDNPPLTMLEDMVAGNRKLALCVDTRTRGFDAERVLAAIERLRRNPNLRVELIFAWADDQTLQRRYTETRRRHPMAPQGRVADGIKAEQAATAPLREHADLFVDTSNLPLHDLRRLIEQHYGPDADSGEARMVLSLVSFAYPRGLPSEADLVFDARFLRNPHYVPDLQPRTGLDPAVQAYVAADPDHAAYCDQITALVDMVLPRFVQEGKKYATIAIGCTGGRHRSVHLVEYLAGHLAARAGIGHGAAEWRTHVTHRELIREGHEHGYRTQHPVSRRETAHGGDGIDPAPVQAQEA